MLACRLTELTEGRIKDFSCSSTLLFCNDERWAKAQGALATTEQEQTFFETLVHRLVAQRSIRRTASISADEFNTDHQSQATHIADDRVLGLKRMEFLL